MSYIKRAIEELQERGISNPTNDDLKMIARERKAEKIRAILDDFMSELSATRGCLFSVVAKVVDERYPDLDNWDKDAGEAVHRYMNDLVEAILKIKA